MRSRSFLQGPKENVHRFELDLEYNSPISQAEVPAAGGFLTDLRNEAGDQTRLHKTGQKKCREKPASNVEMMPLLESSDQLHCKGRNSNLSESGKLEPRSHAQKSVEQRGTGCSSKREINDAAHIEGGGVEATRKVAALGFKNVQVNVSF